MHYVSAEFEIRDQNMTEKSGSVLRCS